MNYAYDEVYILQAQRTLGDMYDYAVNTLGILLKDFQAMFLVSGIDEQFAHGNPMYLVGMNGCELAKSVIAKCKGEYPKDEDVMYIDKSAEYWTGWALAYYEWESGLDFKTIERICPVTEVECMYPTLHEADISVFVDIMNDRADKYFSESRLRRLRRYAELTQTQLSEKSGVPLRQIQLFEQGQRDINKCAVSTVVQLSKALCCNVEELIG